ncbi:alpha/beta fold hydrolase [Kordiimonas sp. SCSIO 12610]|uniref:alpha/beta fold hydrolase n=1 Tax=Kordiimonas sp. SCSIO 12610 TaxID=2829597 RepID=UPI00210B3280|nr:alpha/beta hydrolase [Kordiimonas sp. SCSIO 12610]UTW56756.1 alpha/beta hydrolase [Kordiimonas sp. SCSIO 12610]
MQIFRVLFAIVFVTFSLAIVIAWTPDIAPEDLREKYAYGASTFVELPSGATAHFRDEGDKNAAPIVLLHGSNSSLHTWEAWVSDLKADYRIITVDLPGHGLTGPTPAGMYGYKGMSNFVHEFVQTLGLQNFVLGGNSMGGGISLYFTQKYPEFVNSLILVDASGAKLPVKEEAKTDPPLAFRLAGRWYTDWIIGNITPRSLSAEGLKKTFTNHAVIDDKMIDRYWELVRYPGNREATGKRFAGYRADRTEIDLSTINVPSLIIWGEDDNLIPVEAGRVMDREIKNSELVVFKNAGHIPMEEIPEKTLEAVRTFLKKR